MLYGHYDFNYVVGSFLLLMYLLLATVLLLNLIVAKFSSTYLQVLAKLAGGCALRHGGRAVMCTPASASPHPPQIESHSYEQWCLLVADVVDEYHESKVSVSDKSPLVIVPAPLNLITTVAFAFEKVLHKWSHNGDALHA